MSVPNSEEHPPNARERPYALLRAAILDARHPPGADLRESALASEMGVSRTPVREALAKLEYEGLLERTARGLRVKHRSREELYEVYEAVVVIESAVAGLAALRARPQDCAELDLLMDAISDAVAGIGDPMPLTRAWHAALWRAAGNHELEAELHRLSALLHQIPPAPLSRSDWMDRLSRQRAIVSALRDHDADAASVRVARHRESERDHALMQASGSLAARGASASPAIIPPSVPASLIDDLLALIGVEEPAVVLIDGRSGSGKSTLAPALATALDAEIVALDSLYPGWGGLEAGGRHVREELLGGPERRWQAWDWERDRPGLWHRLDPDRALVIEGTGALSTANRRLASFGIWVEVDNDSTRRARAFARDGQLYVPHWESWAAQEQAFITRERPQRIADAIVDGTDWSLSRAAPVGPTARGRR